MFIFFSIIGQYYTINLKDKKQYDGEIKSTIAISFHDENQRTSAADYWKYWLAQQNNASNPKAVELGKQISILQLQIISL